MVKPGHYLHQYSQEFERDRRAGRAHNVEYKKERVRVRNYAPRTLERLSCFTLTSKQVGPIVSLPC